MQDAGHVQRHMSDSNEQERSHLLSELPHLPLHMGGPVVTQDVPQTSKHSGQECSTYQYSL
jgi:hypothetical protein